MTHFNEAWSKREIFISFNSLTILDYSVWTPFTSVGLIHTIRALILFESLMSSLDHILEKQEYKKEKRPSTQHHYWFKLSLFCSAALLWWIPTLPVPTPGCVVILSWYHDDCNLQMCFSISACLSVSAPKKEKEKKIYLKPFYCPHFSFPSCLECYYSNQCSQFFKTLSDKITKTRITGLWMYSMCQPSRLSGYIPFYQESHKTSTMCEILWWLKCILWGHGDIDHWPPKSSQFSQEFKWPFVPELNKFSQRHMYGQPEKNMPLALAIADMEAWKRVDMWLSIMKTVTWSDLFCLHDVKCAGQKNNTEATIHQSLSERLNSTLLYYTQRCSNCHIIYRLLF